MERGHLYLEIYDSNFVMHGVVSDFLSLTWVTSCYGDGTFDLTCEYTDSIVDMMIPGRFVMRSDIESVYYITSVEQSRDITGNRQVRVTGYDAVYILSQRVVKTEISSATGVSTTLSDVVSGLLAVTVQPQPLLPDAARRQLRTWLSFDLTGVPNVTNLQYKYYGENLYDALRELMSAYGFGVSATRVYTSGQAPIKITFSAHRDLTNVIVFSESLNNIRAWSYKRTTESCWNAVYVHGDQVLQSDEAADATGLNRYEEWIESSTSKTFDDGTTMDPAMYTLTLKHEAMEARAENRWNRSALTAELDDSIYHYLDDYQTGDFIWLETPPVSTSILVEGVTEIFDSTGYSIGGAVAAFVTSIFSLIQSRKGKQDEIISRLEKIKQEQDKAEKDSLRTQLLVLLADYRDEKAEILTCAERYFSPPINGDWYMSTLFLRYIEQNEIGKPEWFNPDN